MTTEDYMDRVAARMRREARRWPWNGQGDAAGMALIERCRRLDGRTGANIVFTLDHGHHTSGWWKNPDYERCRHLSVSSLAALLDGDPRTRAQAGQLPELTMAGREAWARAFFRDHLRLVWVEPPVTENGRRLGVYHYRLFIDPSGVPLLPRGEVYTREFTEAGWKSWSDVQAESTP